MRCFSLVGSFLLAASATAQTTWYVDVSGTAPGSGTPADPYTSIQYAIARSTTVAGDTVDVAAGTYFENLDFLGKAITVRTSSAVVDANGSGPVVRFTNGEGPASILDGFTLTDGGGTTGPTAYDSRGGGVYCVGASPTLRALTVESNLARYGGGMYFAGSAATIDACLVRANNGGNGNEYPQGCGIWSNSTIQVSNTTIRDHQFGNAGQWSNYGGGIYGSGTFTNCTIANNTATFGGGAYAGGGVPLLFVGCTFDRNTAAGDGEATPGGGICALASTTVLRATECTFTENVAGEGGAAYQAELIRCDLLRNVARRFTGGSAGAGGGAALSTLVDCDVIDNRAGLQASSPFGFSAQGTGGGIVSSQATRCRLEGNVAISVGGFQTGRGGGAAASTLVDCVVVDNEVIDVSPSVLDGRGGGISGGSATRTQIVGNRAALGGGGVDASLENCTISGNTSTVAGGGAASSSSFEPTVLRNCIVWNNVGGSLAVVGSGSLTATYSDVQGGYAGTGNINADPLFVNAPSSDFRLQVSSPCINAGDPTTFDPDGSRADMGAFPFECGVSIYCVGKVNSQSCTPAIAWSGTTSLSGTDDFVVTGSGFVNQKTGILFWGRNPASVPFQGGTLCVAGGLVRTAVQNSGGNPLPPPDCSGSYAWAFTHAYMNANAMLEHQTIHAQWYSRDPLSADGTGVSLSNAIAFTICP